MSKIIFLDPGHGGADPGAVNGSRTEKADVLKLGLRVRELLAKSDVNIKMTRDSDVEPLIKQRVAMANAAKADLFISLHRNAAADPSAHGIEIYTVPGCSVGSQRAAELILNGVLAVGGANRGIKRSNNYGVIRDTSMPAVLLELGFITNSEDNQLFDDKFNAYALEIAQAICAWAGVDYINLTDGQSAAPAPGNLYRVQVGAYSVKVNAEAMLDKLKNAGFEAIIVGG